jgi:hypothetical protein
MVYRFDLARLDELIGKRVKVVRPEAHSVQVGQIIDVTTAIPVRLRQILMSEGRGMKELRAEYGRRIHLNVKLDRGDEILVTWEDIEFVE